MATLLQASLLLLSSTYAGPCCRTCTLPKAMYISVVSKEPFCGQTCIDPKNFNIYHVFEKNLTRDPGGACASQYDPSGTFYTVYNTTVTHGIPGILAVTLDLYGPAVNTSAAISTTISGSSSVHAQATAARKSVPSPV
jgi:hypothetical protein